MFTKSVVLFFSSLHLCLCIDLMYYATEGKKPGTFLGDIAADTNLMEDKDHNSITFIQLQEDATDGFNLFRVSKTTGKLYTAQMLDAESLCKRNTECFRILDVAAQKGEIFMQIFEIKITIQDINDHHPEFSVKQVDIEFSEDDKRGRGRLIPSAIDQDVSFINSQITYDLRKKVKPFSLTVSNRVDGTVDLVISLEDNLDREETDAYDLQVVAKDKGTPAKQAILNVRVSVLDVNDNVPVFPQNLYNVSVINEHYSSMPLVVLSATDSDMGKNGQVSYRFSSQTPDNVRSHFELQETTGEIFLCKKFVPGQDLKSKLYVKAVDGGTPPQSSVVMVLVNVISDQNNAPTVDVNFVSVPSGKIAAISEAVQVGSFIAYVKVTDHDVGVNGEVTCSIQHEKFQLQDLGPKKYKVTIKQALDRETETHHDVIIRCQDKGSPPLQRESKFSIQVLDANDVLPTFSKETFQFWTAENQRSKIIVGYITATDPDLGTGGQLTYSLLDSHEQFLPFHVTDDGFISTTSSLDHESKEMYKFRVLVRDNGTPPLNSTANVVVEVTDVNDNAPYFTFPGVNPFKFEFNYHPRRKNNITMLRASDSDSRENAFLKYEITSGNDKHLFTINRYTGLLSFTRVATQEDAGFYDLHFAVKDSGRPVRSVETAISLMLSVSNDTSEVYFTDISSSEEGMDVGLLILTVLLAVAASMALVIPITICIIRHNDRRNASRRNQVNPKPCSKCTTAPEAEREEGRPRPPAGGTAMILQTTTTEVCVQEVAVSSGGACTNVEASSAEPGCSNGRNEVATTSQPQLMPAPETCLSYLPHIHQPGGFQSEDMKHLLRTFSCPENGHTIPNFVFQTNIEDLKKEGIKVPGEGQVGEPLALTENGETSANQCLDTGNPAPEHCLQVPCSPYCVQGTYTSHPQHKKLYRSLDYRHVGTNRTRSKCLPYICMQIDMRWSSLFNKGKNLPSQSIIE